MVGGLGGWVAGGLGGWVAGVTGGTVTGAVGEGIGGGTAPQLARSKAREATNMRWKMMRDEGYACRIVILSRSNSSSVLCVLFFAPTAILSVSRSVFESWSRAFRGVFGSENRLKPRSPVGSNRNFEGAKCGLRRTPRKGFTQRTHLSAGAGPVHNYPLPPLCALAQLVQVPVGF